jgi:hypothetical protein
LVDIGKPVYIAGTNNNSMKQISTTRSLSTGMKVYFEDIHYQGNGTVHYIPNEKEQAFYIETEGENYLSVKPVNGKPRFVPVSQIVLL